MVLLIKLPMVIDGYGSNLKQGNYPLVKAYSEFSLQSGKPATLIKSNVTLSVSNKRFYPIKKPNRNGKNTKSNHICEKIYIHKQIPINLNNCFGDNFSIIKTRTLSIRFPSPPNIILRNSKSANRHRFDFREERKSIVLLFVSKSQNFLPKKSELPLQDHKPLQTFRSRIPKPVKPRPNPQSKLRGTTIKQIEAYNERKLYETNAVLTLRNNLQASKQNKFQTFPYKSRKNSSNTAHAKELESKGAEKMPLQKKSKAPISQGKSYAGNSSGNKKNVDFNESMSTQYSIYTNETDDLGTDNSLNLLTPTDNIIQQTKSMPNENSPNCCNDCCYLKLEEDINRAILELLNLYSYCSNDFIGNLVNEECPTYTNILGPSIDESIFSIIQTIGTCCGSTGFEPFANIKKIFDRTVCFCNKKWITEVPNTSNLIQWLKNEYDMLNYAIESLNPSATSTEMDMLNSKKYLLDCLADLANYKKHFENDDYKKPEPDRQIENIKQKEEISIESDDELTINATIGLRNSRKNYSEAKIKCVLRKNHLISLKTQTKFEDSDMYPYRLYPYIDCLGRMLNQVSQKKKNPKSIWTTINRISASMEKENTITLSKYSVITAWPVITNGINPKLKKSHIPRLSKKVHPAKSTTLFTAMKSSLSSSKPSEAKAMKSYCSDEGIKFHQKQKLSTIPEGPELKLRSEEITENKKSTQKLNKAEKSKVDVKNNENTFTIIGFDNFEVKPSTVPTYYSTTKLKKIRNNEKTSTNDEDEIQSEVISKENSSIVPLNSFNRKKCQSQFFSSDNLNKTSNLLHSQSLNQSSLQSYDFVYNSLKDASEDSSFNSRDTQSDKWSTTDTESETDIESESETNSEKMVIFCTNTEIVNNALIPSHSTEVSDQDEENFSNAIAVNLPETSSETIMVFLTESTKNIPIGAFYSKIKNQHVDTLKKKSKTKPLKPLQSWFKRFSNKGLQRKKSKSLNDSTLLVFNDKERVTKTISYDLLSKKSSDCQTEFSCSSQTLISKNPSFKSNSQVPFEEYQAPATEVEVYDVKEKRRAENLYFRTKFEQISAHRKKGKTLLAKTNSKVPSPTYSNRTQQSETTALETNMNINKDELVQVKNFNKSQQANDIASEQSYSTNTKYNNLTNNSLQNQSPLPLTEESNICPHLYDGNCQCKEDQFVQTENYQFQQFNDTVSQQSSNKRNVDDKPQEPSISYKKYSINNSFNQDKLSQSDYQYNKKNVDSKSQEPSIYSKNYSINNSFNQDKLSQSEYQRDKNNFDSKPQEPSISSKNYSINNSFNQDKLSQSDYQYYKKNIDSKPQEPSISSKNYSINNSFNQDKLSQSENQRGYQDSDSSYFEYTKSQSKKGYSSAPTSPSSESNHFCYTKRFESLRAELQYPDPNYRQRCAKNPNNVCICPKERKFKHSFYSSINDMKFLIEDSWFTLRERIRDYMERFTSLVKYQPIIRKCCKNVNCNQQQTEPYEKSLEEEEKSLRSIEDALMLRPLKPPGSDSMKGVKDLFLEDEESSFQPDKGSNETSPVDFNYPTEQNQKECRCDLLTNNTEKENNYPDKDFVSCKCYVFENETDENDQSIKEPKSCCTCCESKNVEITNDISSNNSDNTCDTSSKIIDNTKEKPCECKNALQSTKDSQRLKLNCKCSIIAEQDDQVDSIESSKMSSVKEFSIRSNKKNSIESNATTNKSNNDTKNFDNKSLETNRKPKQSIQSVKYALVRILEYDNLKTFEVMNHTKKVPKDVPSKSEDIFVVKKQAP